MQTNKLSQALTQVIRALETETILYDWVEQGSCNCGLIVQSLLEKSSKEVLSNFTEEKLKTKFTLQDKVTWKQLLQQRCSITGLPLEGIFQNLYDLGLRPEDITHLEYLSNTGILKDSGIDTSKEKYYQNRTNLIKYLKSWLRILQAPPISTIENTTHNKTELEQRLLQQVNAEDFEAAAQTRDRISQLV